MQENVSKDLSQLGPALEWASEYFESQPLYFGHGTDNAWDEAVFIMSHCLDKSYLSTNDLENKLTMTEQTAFEALCIKRVEQRIPAAYLVGEMLFAGLRFQINEHVLIPRSPIAELIENAFLPWISDLKKSKRVLDLCTGSGCIGIAIAHYFPWLQVDISDISENALVVAEKNIQMHHLETNVKRIQSDLFENISERYDLIVSNPPYVSQKSWQDLPPEYHHEPTIGLVAADQGLALVANILLEAEKYLTPQGVLIIEVGELAPTVEAAYGEYPLIWIEFENGGEGIFTVDFNTLKAINSEQKHDQKN